MTPRSPLAAVPAAMVYGAAFGLAAVLPVSVSIAGPAIGSSSPSLTQGLDDLLGPPAAAGVGDQKPALGQPTPGLMPDQKLLDKMIQQGLEDGPPGPIVGEDIGQAKQDPLERVQQNMGHASQMIDRIDARSKQVQQQIVSDLDELIAKMEKQCQGGQCNNPQQKESQQSQRSQPKQAQSKPKPGQQKPGQPKPGQSQAASAAGDSTLRLSSSAAAEAQGRSSQELMKEVWGHLPERLREQMLQSSSDEFLPQYREEIERYFQRLAEEEAAGGR